MSSCLSHAFQGFCKVLMRTRVYQTVGGGDGTTWNEVPAVDDADDAACDDVQPVLFLYERLQAERETVGIAQMFTSCG